ncbi:MAG TPA: glycosyltransferase [Methylomirabilota bacterium]|jgi:undecaprenyl-phosphate 4-deoxy-4-formamido-L-arabinose transferase
MPPQHGQVRECTVVIPVYNSQATLPALTERLAMVLPGVAARFEVVLVNDGSRDGSWEAIGQAARKYPWVRGLNLMRNYGQHNALLAGIRAARYDLTVTMDDDLQHPPEEIPVLLGTLGQDHDLVYGVPASPQQGLSRKVSSRLTKLWLHRVLGVAIASRASAFRAFRTVLRDGFAHYEGPAVAIDALLAWTTTRIASVEVRHEPRRHGRSQYTWLKLARLAFDLTTTFRTWPLRLASLVGFVVMLLGLAALAFVLGSYLATGRPLSVFRFLASTLAIFSGAQLLTLGILGEYVARIHHRVLREPAYVVRERIGEPVDGDA